MATLAVAAASAPLRLLASIAAQTEAPAESAVKRVLIVFKCHLDVGFTNTQAKVMRTYFDVYYPEAMRRAAEAREAAGDRYIWTTGSWLLYEYLEQATPAQKTAMETSVAAGDIAWHALPFSWQTEMIDRSMIEGAFGFSRALDSRFGRKTVGAKMTDVPGHTRGIIAPLQAAGVKLLDIGVNAASTPPDVPDVFLWKDTQGNSVVMLYHRHDYGSVLRIPGSDLAVAVEVRGDNSGPHTPAEVAAIYARLRTQFPSANVEAANFNDVARAVEPFRAKLPVVTGEIGDTWIYGAPSDPYKVARYREIARLRRDWIANKRFSPGDATDRQLLRRLLLAAEHTWGTDTKKYLDYKNYKPLQLASMLAQPGYQTMQTSWQEKRDDIDLGVASLPDPLRNEANARLATLNAIPPQPHAMQKLATSSAIQTKHYTLSIDPQSGAITQLLEHASGRDWASPQAPLALFTYQTLSSADFASFLARYVTSKEDWAPRDFGKPGIENFGARSQQWHPRLVQAYIQHSADAVTLLLHLRIDDPTAMAAGSVAWPSDIYLELTLPVSQAVVQLRLTTLGKIANRLPEAMWLSFHPSGCDLRGCRLEKSGETVIASDVVRGGGRAMHAVSERLSLQRAEDGATLKILTLDAPVVALGERSPLNFSKPLPPLQEGIHFSLFNNAWGTNYPQWGSGDWSFRFTLSTAT